MTKVKFLKSQKDKIFKAIIKFYKKEQDLELAKRKVAKKFHLSQVPKKFEILKYLKKTDKNFFKNLLKSKEKIHKMRSLSGIVSVTVLTKPYSCPYKCAYCPKEKGMPQSYLSAEPAASRAKVLNFDPYLQVKKRLNVLKIGGHPTDKIELIVLGGTFSLLPKKYRKWFIKRCFDAANNKKSKNLKQAQKINERAKQRIIGITIETRPDLINKSEIRFLRELGVTRVEIGMQNFFNFVLQKNDRGHDRNASVQATYLLKEAGFKVCYHLMLNLPGSNPFWDWLSCILFFYHPDFKPDQIKIYPLMIVKGSKIYQWFKKKKIRTYAPDTLIRILASIKRFVPQYVRIVRIIRDIPAHKVEEGLKFSNLRENVQRFMEKKGIRCQCIRCREIKDKIIKNPKLLVIKYKASRGIEYFLSITDREKNRLGAFLRLRIPHYFQEKEKPIFKVLENSAIIREIHTYGQTLAINSKSDSAFQHHGFGKILLREAEKIVQTQGIQKIAVIAGIGAREYFRKIGYKQKASYMVKKV